MVNPVVSCACGGHRIFRGVAQLVEQSAHNRRVVGSSPTPAIAFVLIDPKVRSAVGHCGRQQVRERWFDS